MPYNKRANQLPLSAAVYVSQKGSRDSHLMCALDKKAKNKRAAAEERSSAPFLFSCSNIFPLIELSRPKTGIKRSGGGFDNLFSPSAIHFEGFASRDTTAPTLWGPSRHAPLQKIRLGRT